MFMRRAQNARVPLATCRCHEDFHELGVHDPAQEQPRAVLRVPTQRKPAE